MIKYNLKDYIRGWVVGSFKPALYNKDYEIGFKYYVKGDKEASHKHLLSEEITIILLGEVEMNGIKYIEGDIVVQKKMNSQIFCVYLNALLLLYIVPMAHFQMIKYLAPKLSLKRFCLLGAPT